MNANNWMKLQFPSESENVAFARTTMALFASQLEFTLEDLDDIKVVISEAVSNAIIHGYKESSGTVVMEASFADGELTIAVEDFGHGIPDIGQAKEAGYSSIPEERMGLGLVFIHEYMDRVEIKSTVGQGTRIVMHKKPRSQ